MIYPLSVRRENELLRRELGTQFGRARYQWAHSDDIRMPIVVHDDEGQIVYDYCCGCGVNVSVHSANCKTLTIPRARWEVQNLVPDLSNQWVLARWLRPEMSRANWNRVFSGVPYPSEGYLMPVGDLMQCLALRPGETPRRETTEIMIAAVREHFSVSALQRNRDTEEYWATRDAKKKQDYKLQCKDAFPVHTGWAGDKEEWSHGGDPNTESPTLRKFESTTVQ